MNADPELLQKLGRLDDFILRLERYVQDLAGSEKEDAIARDACEMSIIRIVECAWDICQILYLENGLAIPDSYRSAFERLPELAIASNEEAAEFVQVVRMRNRLVHNYDAVELPEFRQTADLAIRIFSQLAVRVYKLLGISPDGPNKQGD